MKTVPISDHILKQINCSNKKARIDATFKKINKLVSISNTYDICKLLTCDFDIIQNAILNPNYTEFEIPKQNKTGRKIQAPNSELKAIQKTLNHYFQLYYYFVCKPEFVNGFVIRPIGEAKKCNIRSNAQVHVGKKYVLNIDLKDFFFSIRTKMVYDLFQSELFNFDENVAKTLTFLCTYKGSLPTGSPTSPVISNFMCIKMDHALETYCQKHQVQLSRYADDLTFSSNTPFPEEFITEISKLVSNFGFQVNSQKTYLKKQHQKQCVTGLIVNEKVNIDRKTLKKTRAMLHTWKTKGLDHAVNIHYKNTKKLPSNPKTHFVNQLSGYINFIGQIRGKNDELYLKYKEIHLELKRNE